MAALHRAAKYWEESPRKQTVQSGDRVAAVHNLGDQSLFCKRYFRVSNTIVDIIMSTVIDKTLICVQH
jgi:hypothetical protein